jgi:hypothetical protein
MLERPIPARLATMLGALALTACAGGRPAPEAAEAGARAPRPVLESVRPARPDDRAAAARSAWLERQAAARSGQPPASAPPQPAAAGATQPGSPGKLLIFSSSTGHVPIGDVKRSTARTPEQREAERVAELERALEAERAREQRPEQAGPEPPGSPRTAPPGLETSVLSAPFAPSPPELDPARLSTETTSVPAGSWGNAEDLPVLRRSLDADGNGRPEDVRYYEVGSDQLLRREEDRDLDGNTDSWIRYERGAAVERVLDSDGDGRPDEWEYYSNGRMTRREIDSNHDDSRDITYLYRNDSLSEVRRDTDADGAIDRVEKFEHRQRVQLVEDANRDQRMDTWTSYRIVAGEEVVARIERDPQGRGKPTVFETYRAAPGKPVLERLEEDTDGDGAIDVTKDYQRDGSPSPEPVAPL